MNNKEVYEIFIGGQVCPVVQIRCAGFVLSNFWEPVRSSLQLKAQCMLNFSPQVRIRYSFDKKWQTHNLYLLIYIHL